MYVLSPLCYNKSVKAICLLLFYEVAHIEVFPSHKPVESLAV